MPPTRVVKFGGTALGTLRRVQWAARHIARCVAAGQQVVVVVSANGRRTDRLLAHAEQLAPEASTAPAQAREVARLLATGEDASAALLALALRRCGVDARSLRDAAAGLHADGGPLDASLRPVDPAPITALLARGIVPVVSGFHATGADGEVVLLGRGSSDLVAIAIAAALRRGDLDEVQCDIVTDVDGVYDRDPRGDPSARRYRFLTFETMAQLAERGDQVIARGAAQCAAETGTPFRVTHWRHPASAARATRVGAPLDRLIEAHGDGPVPMVRTPQFA